MMQSKCRFKNALLNNCPCFRVCEYLFQFWICHHFADRICSGVPYTVSYTFCNVHHSQFCLMCIVVYNRTAKTATFPSGTIIFPLLTILFLCLQVFIYRNDFITDRIRSLIKGIQISMFICILINRVIVPVITFNTDKLFLDFINHRTDTLLKVRRRFPQNIIAIRIAVIKSRKLWNSFFCQIAVFSPKNRI